MENKFESNNSDIQKEPEREMSPEIKKEFDALIVLGNNWRQYPPKEASPQDWRLRLSLESKISALAAGVMFTEGIISKIIFSGGKTAGKNWPSEAKAMSEFLRTKYPDISGASIILEEEAIDTAQNAEKVLAILQKYNLKKTALLTSGSHLPRAGKLFENYGIKATGFVSEELLKKRDPHYEKFVEKYLDSSRRKIEEVKEVVLRAMIIIDPKGKLLRAITKKIRQTDNK